MIRIDVDLIKHFIQLSLDRLEDMIRIPYKKKNLRTMARNNKGSKTSDSKSLKVSITRQMWFDVVWNFQK